MAVAFRTESHSIASTANANPGEPTGTVSGDVLVGLILVNGTAAAPSLPTGWTSLYTVTSTNGGTTNGFKAAVGYIVRGGSAAATTFTNGAVYREAYILAFSGVDNTTPIDSQSSSGTNYNASSTNPNPPSTTAVSSAAMAVCGGIYWAGSATAWTAPAGYTIRSNNAAGNDGVIASKLLSASGAEDPAVFTGGVTGSVRDGWNGFTITLAPASSGTSVSLTGVAGTVTVAAPAGSIATIRNAAVTAVAGTVAVAAPAGTVTATGNAVVTGVAGTVTVAAPAGTVTTIQNVSVAGVAGTVAVAAPAGTVTPVQVVSLTGTAGTVAVAAPAGTVTPVQVVSLTGAAGAVTVAAPAGAVSATAGSGTTVSLTGVAGTVTVAAPAGSVTTVQNVSLVGSPGQVAVTAPAGSVATVQSVLLTGAAGTVVVTAPVGTISISVNLDGAEFSFGHPFTDWDTRSPLTEWDSGFPVDEWASGTLITDWTTQPAMTGWTSGQPQTD